MPPKYSLEECHRIANSHPEGGCLSDKYISKMEWYCGIHDYTWTAQCNDVITKEKWCKMCAVDRRKEALRNKEGLQKCIDIARQKGGKCLSSEYTDAKTPLEWECRQGHQWVIEPQRILYYDSWCQECHLEVAREIRMDNLARRR
jgi:hypothetical protein